MFSNCFRGGGASAPPSGCWRRAWRADAILNRAAAAAAQLAFPMGVVRFYTEPSPPPPSAQRARPTQLPLPPPQWSPRAWEADAILNRAFALWELQPPSRTPCVIEKMSVASFNISRSKCCFITSRSKCCFTTSRSNCCFNAPRSKCCFNTFRSKCRFQHSLLNCPVTEVM